MISSTNSMDSSNASMDLLELLYRIELSHPVYGISFRRKLKPEVSWRRYIHVGPFLFFMIVEILIMNSLPVDNERVLLIGGDLVYLVSDKNRWILAPIEVGYVICCFLMLWNYYWDDFRWLKKANDHFRELEIVGISPRIRKLMKTRLWVSTYPLYAFFAIILLALVSPLVLFQERTARHPVWESLFGAIHISVTHYFINYTIAQFLTRVFVMIVFTEDLYRQLNTWTLARTGSGQEPEVFEGFFREFSKICLLFNQLRGFVKLYFILFTIGVTPACILLLYIPIYQRHQQSAILQIVLLPFLPVFLGIVTLIAFRIGRILRTASELEDFWYRFLMDRLRNRKSKVSAKLRSKIQSFFHIVWNENVGVKILGVAVNTDTIISMLIFYLTLLAMTVSSLNKILNHKAKHHAD